MSEETRQDSGKRKSSPVNEELIGNLLSVSQWLRIVLMILYVFLGWAVRFLQYMLVIVQTIIALFTGKENTRLARAGEIAALYQAQIWLFLSYASSNRPFPFSDLPTDESSLDIGVRTASGEIYDVEPEPASEDAGFEDAAEAEMKADPEPTVTETEESSTQTEDEDDVFSDMSFSSAGKDFVNHDDDKNKKNNDDDGMAGKDGVDEQDDKKDS